MLTVALAIVALLLLITLGVVAVLWRAARLEVDACRAELDALSVAGPTVEQRAIAALDNEAPQDTLSDAWLTYVDSLPTTYDREYPR